MKKGQIVKSIEDFRPLFRKGDLFKIIKINKDPALMNVEALHLRDKQIYGFDTWELE